MVEMDLSWIERDSIMLAINEFLATNKDDDFLTEEKQVLKKVSKKFCKTIMVVD